jgi:hypothetical protein
VHDCKVAQRCIEAPPPSAKLVADKGHDSQALREWLEERGTEPVIPPRKNRKIQYDYEKAVSSSATCGANVLPLQGLAPYRRPFRSQPQKLYGRHLLYRRHTVAVASPDHKLNTKNCGGVIPFCSDHDSVKG